MDESDGIISLPCQSQQHYRSHLRAPLAVLPHPVTQHEEQLVKMWLAGFTLSDWQMLYDKKI